MYPLNLHLLTGTPLAEGYEAIDHSTASQVAAPTPGWLGVLLTVALIHRPCRTKSMLYGGEEDSGVQR